MINLTYLCPELLEVDPDCDSSIDSSNMTGFSCVRPWG